MNIQRNLLFSENSGMNELSIPYDGFVTTDKSWKQPPLPSPVSRLYYILEGSGILISEHEELQLEPGYVYLAPCGIPCGFYGTDSVTKLFFHVNVILPDGYDLFSAADHFARLPRSLEEIESLKKRYFSEDAAEQILLKGELWRTVAEFAKTLLPSARRPARYSRHVTSAIAYIRSHLAATLTVSEVAETIFCSTATLSTAFRNEIGSGVAAYIEDLLMFEARRMLLSSDKTIGEISASLGYSDQFYFSRRFRKRFSVSPKEYRKHRTGT